MIYVVIENDTITNRVVCEDEAFASSMGWVQNSEWQIGWVRDGDTFSPQQAEAE